KGNTTFSETFAARSPKDSKGRSLRDYDLKIHLFRYPLSYMIYSDPFDGLPQMAKDKLYLRLYDVLSGKNTSPKFARLSAGDRKGVLEIVRETKPNLPDYWK